MGKNIISQARGKGGPRYRSPSFNYIGKAGLKIQNKFEQTEGTVMDIVHCRGHSAPLALIKYNDGEENLLIASEGLSVGDKMMSAAQEPGLSNIMQLKDIPEGTLIFNVESQPGDEGKFARASGTFAKIIGKTPAGIFVMLPSKKKRMFDPNCRANIGIVAGGGRTDKPFLKAGFMFHHMRQKNKLWPQSSGCKMNAVDHPFGNKRSLRKSKARPVSRDAPPGRKVGMVAPRRTGRKKR